MSGKQVIRALEKLGFVHVRQKGSHVILRKAAETGAVGCVVPLHDELATGTLRGILKQAHVDPDQFAKAL